MATGPLSAEKREIVREAARYADTWIALRARTQRIPGVQVAVAVAGELLLSSANGFARLPGTDGPDDAGEPLTTAHLFRIASHSKTFTATAVLQLVEAGKLRLDDTAGEHVAALSGSPIADRTLAELLAHGGGVVRDTHEADFWQLQREFPDADALVAACLDAPDVLERNERFKYSNIGYGVLGLVIEAASGRPYAEYVAEHVVGRLGLLNTGPELDAARSGEYATGYTGLEACDRRLPIDQVDTRALAAATGFWSTAEDLCRYAAAHVLGDERLLSDASKRRIHRGEWEVEETGDRYGLGFGIHKIGERRLIGHGGGFPGHITRTLFDPIDGLTVVVLTNAIDGPALELVQGVVKLVDAALGNAEEPSEEAVADHSSFTGRFAALWGVTDVVDLGGRLRLVGPNQADPTAVMGKLEVEDADTLRIAEAIGFSSPGERVRYTRSDGRVVRVVLGGLSAVPIEEHVSALSGLERIVLGGAHVPVRKTGIPERGFRSAR
jgi:CubicO group peptidase (beta-lactamase class C family)